MTAHYIHPMLYTCDGGGCKAEAEGTNVRLPNGWREWTRVEGAITERGFEEITGHICPKCQAPESTGASVGGGR